MFQTSPRTSPAFKAEDRVVGGDRKAPPLPFPDGGLHCPLLDACALGQNGAQSEVNVTSSSQSQKKLCRIHPFPAQIVADRPLHFLLTSLATQQVCLERLMWSLKRCSAVNSSQVPPPHPSTSTVFLGLFCIGVSHLLSFKPNGRRQRRRKLAKRCF